MQKNLKRKTFSFVTAMILANSFLCLPVSALEFPELKAPTLDVPEANLEFSTDLTLKKFNAMNELYSMGYGSIENRGMQGMGSFSVGNGSVTDYYDSNFDSFGDSDWQSFGQQAGMPSKDTLLQGQTQLKDQYNQLSSSLPSAYEASMQAFAEQQMSNELAADTFNTALKTSYLAEDMMFYHERQLLEEAGASEAELEAFDNAHYEKTQNRYKNSEDVTKEALIDWFAQDEEAYKKYQAGVANGTIKDYQLPYYNNPVLAAQAERYGGIEIEEPNPDTALLDMYAVPKNNVVDDVITKETDGDGDSWIKETQNQIVLKARQSDNQFISDTALKLDTALFIMDAMGLHPVDTLLGYEGAQMSTASAVPSTEELSSELHSGMSRERKSDEQVVSEIYE